MKRPAVFLDRDGTINEQMGYINHLSRFVILPGAAEAIRLLNENGSLVIIVSNQSGVARGYFPIALVHEVHEYLRETLRQKGAVIDRILFCPHYHRGSVSAYSCDCECRKPKTGLIDAACAEFDIDLPNSYVVGDRYTDIELAHRAGLKGIMVKTGYGMGDIEYVLPRVPRGPDHIARDLLDAVHWLLKDKKSAR
jgi:D-glycero-D-manno-heptose 1,7-bisphosphate phosphatase